MKIFSKKPDIDLFEAVKSGDDEVLRKGVRRRAKRDKKDGVTDADPFTFLSVETKDGWTLLMWACLHGHSSCVRTLIEHSANLDYERADGCNALW